MGKRVDLAKAATAAELVEYAGYSQRTAAEMMGLDRDTVGSILRGDYGWDKITETPVFRQHRVNQNKALEQAARTLAAQSWTEAANKIEDASYYQLVVGGSILIDKARLLAGESTENVLVHTKHDVSGLEKLASALGQALLPIGHGPQQPEQVVASGVQVPDNTTPVIDSVSTHTRKRAKRKVKAKS